MDNLCHDSPRWLALTLFLLALPVFARGVYQTDREFLKEVFDGDPPRAKVLWLSSELKPRIKAILGHPYSRLRVKYWRRGSRSAWILDEIGKEKPITVGFVIENGRIRRVKVLAFRESRGWEVVQPFFTRQFKGAALNRNLALDRPIDGITGATLSVNALKKLARLALYLQSVETNEKPTHEKKSH